MRGEIGVWSWDIKSNIVQWSGNLEIGLPASGTFASFQQGVHPEDQPEVIAAIQESLRSGKPYHVHYRLAPRSDEEDRWLEAVASVVNGEDGKPARLLGICRDVTDRQKLLRELRVRAKQQETLARLGEQALTETDLQKLFDEMASTVAEILDVEFVKILELVPGDAELLLRAGRGWRDGLVGTAHEFDRPPFASRLRAWRLRARLGRAGDRPRSEIRDALRCAGVAASSTASTAASAFRSPDAMAAPTACSARTPRGGAASANTTSRS